MKRFLLILSLACVVTGCATKKYLMKNCQSVHDVDNHSLCEKP